LSGGQQQRVGLARALAANPAALLMDEAFGALDPITRVKIRKEFLSLEELREKTIVMVTHDVQEAFEMGDKIALFHEGRIIQNAPPATILKHPANTFVKDFIAADLLSLSLKQSGLYDELNKELKQGKLDLDKLHKP
jgi:osmoprotectant transport system ATP-binding protein